MIINPSVDPQYMRLISMIDFLGENSDDRTGVGTKSLFGGNNLVITMTNLKTGGWILPAIGVRRVSPRIAFKELMFMLNGKTQTKELEKDNVNIWKGNTSREFLDDRGLTNLEEGDFGRMYGAQLREFNGLENEECPIGFDQLEYMVNEIKTNPTSRRIIATHYNPAEANQGALFPCHIMVQFNCNIRKGTLDCLFWMRSSDVGYGLPYNLMYYGFFLGLMCKLTGYKPGTLVYQSGDCHLYKDQIESGMFSYMSDNLKKYHVHDYDSMTPPIFEIDKEINTIEDMLTVRWEDIRIFGYSPFSDFDNKVKMAV